MTLFRDLSQLNTSWLRSGSRPGELASFFVEHSRAAPALRRTIRPSGAQTHVFETTWLLVQMASFFRFGFSTTVPAQPLCSRRDPSVNSVVGYFETSVKETAISGSGGRCCISSQL